MRRIALVAFGALFGLSAPAQAELLVNISKSQQRLSVTIDGTEAYRWPISSGRRGYDTPSGNFRPHRLERHWYSRQYEMTPMPWAVFFHRGYAVHGTTEAYNLGHPASHGCVRLRPDNAAILYSLMRRHGLDHTKVVVMNGALPAPPGTAPMSGNDKPKPQAGNAAADNFAMATGDEHEEHEELAAKTHPPERETRAVAEREASRSGAVVYRVSVGSDESKILREREAWLRSLDRKYGITK